MKLTHGDPQYLVLYDEQGEALATCVSIEARDRLIETAAEVEKLRAALGREKTRADLYAKALSVLPGAVWVEHLAGGAEEAVWEGNQAEVAARAIVNAARAEGGE